MIALLAALLAVVNSPNNTVPYACDGVTAVYTINYPYLAYTDLVATSTTAGGAVTTLAYTTDYTVNLTSTSSTATLTLNNPATKCPSGSTLRIIRAVAYTQPYSFKMQTMFNQTLHEIAYDRLAMQISQLATILPTAVALGLQDEGGALGNIATLNCSGLGIVCTAAAGVGTLVLTNTPALINVADRCGVTPPGNATSCVQAALDAAVVGQTVWMPPGTYIFTSTGVTINKSLTLWMDKGAVITTAGISAIVVSGATNVTVHGGKIVLLTDANGAEIQNAITPLGTVTNLTVEDVEIVGQATVPDGTHAVQTGFGNLSGQTLTNIKVRNCTMSSVNVGISFNADLSGSVNGCLAEDNHLTSIIGTASGSGYGIHHANGSGNASHCRIVHNEIDGAQRHGIYQAKGSGFLIAYNVIRLHRTGVGTGANLPGILVSRSQDGAVDTNYFDQPSDGAGTVLPETSTGAGNVAHNILVARNVVKNPKLFPPFAVGTTAPSTDGVAELITLDGNTVYNDTTVSGYSGDLLRINSGKRIKVSSNQFYWLNATGSGGVVGIRGTSEGAGTATYSDTLNFTDNTLYSTNNGGTSFGWNWQAAAATSSIRVELNGNHVYTANNAHVFGAGQTDPNIVVNGVGQSSGLTLNLGSNGQITLAAGTGTATVPAGCKAICQDQTATNVVKCDVSGTTLTATGTGTDVINYNCIR